MEELTLQDVIAHMNRWGEDLRKEIKSAARGVRSNSESLEKCLTEINDLNEQVSGIREDCDLFFGDVSKHVAIEIPHVKARLSRLEEFAKLAPLSAPNLSE